MRTRTPARAAQERLYAIIRIVFLEHHPLCQCCIALGRGQEAATQVHHRAGREGWLLVLVDYFLAVCMDCHEWIERNGKEAKARGWRLELPTLTREQREETERRARAIAASKTLEEN